MLRTFEFLQKVLDSVSEHIVVIDEDGVILFTNRAWDAFGQANLAANSRDWRGVNYLEVCEQAADTGDDFGRKAVDGIRGVMLGSEAFHLEYPCHDPEAMRWFMMSVTTFRYESANFIVISHKDITERKRVEMQALNLSRLDGLTGLFNRRHFDQFLHEEWRRCARLHLPMTLVMVDIDFFKMLNDTYGHQYGDDSLVKIGQVLKKYGKRPSDICARYGGEEFVLAFGNSTTVQVLPLVHQLQEEISALKILNEAAPAGEFVTISAGVATMYPAGDVDESTLIEAADNLLYVAKRTGRNQIATGQGEQGG